MRTRNVSVSRTCSGSRKALSAGVTVNVASRPPASAYAYVFAIGPKMWPSTPVSVKRGMNPVMMMAAANSMDFCTTVAA